MEYLGISFELGNVPQLEPDFIPFAAWARAYLRGAGVPVSVAVEREGGKVTVRHTRIHGTAELHDADRRYLERYVKFLLWSVGGGRVMIQELNGMEVNFSGEADTLIIRHLDAPGAIARVTHVLAEAQINIATMRVFRKKAGGEAIMALELDKLPEAEIVTALKDLRGISDVTLLKKR